MTQEMDEKIKDGERLLVSSAYVQGIVKENNDLLSRIKELEDNALYWKERYRIERGEVFALWERVKELEEGK
jgi:predicted nuclease with TOPRIM domain